MGVVDIIDDRTAASRFAGMPIEFYNANPCGDAGAAADVIEVATERFGGLPDVIGCHAGVVVSAAVLEMTEDDLDRTFAANVRAAFMLAQAGARAWVAAERGGHLIFTSSWVAGVAWPAISAYSASKAALESLARSFANELPAFGIRANCIAPGIVGAGLALRQWQEDPGYRAIAERAIPLGGLQDPKSVPDAYAFLCSDDAAYMTGSTLTVDGGCSLYPAARDR